MHHRLLPRLKAENRGGTDEETDDEMEPTKKLTTTPSGGRQPRLNTRQVALWLGSAVRTITEWAVAWNDSGGAQGIPSHRYGKRKWSFIEGEIQAWMDAGGLLRQFHYDGHVDGIGTILTELSVRSPLCE